MKLLLDTQLLLWLALKPSNVSLSVAFDHMINDPQNELIFSAASIWEVVIKCALKRKDFCIDARLLRRGLLDNGYNELEINGVHAIAIANLPSFHKDPFDRILVAQSMVEGILLLTTDAIIAQYSSSIQLVNFKKR